MPYSQIDISEVGPAEYSLIAVLRDSIFGEFKHRFGATFAEQIDGRRDVLALIAHLEGNPVGYKVGYQDRPGRYYSWTGGVLKDYRRQGVARRMQDWQHGWLRARGYHRVAFNTFNKFRPMIRFGLATGFVPTAVEVQPENEISIGFTKDLTQADPPQRDEREPAVVHVESISPNFHGLVARLATETGRPMTEVDVDADMTGPDALALVAFVDDKPVGFATGRGADARRRSFVTTGGVLAEWRGRGVGTALVRHLIGAAETLGYQTVRIEAPHHDVPLIRLAIDLDFDVGGLTFDGRSKTALLVLERPLGSPDATPGPARP